MNTRDRPEQNAHSRTQHFPPARACTHARILWCCRAQVLATAEKMRLKGQVRSMPPPHAVNDVAGKIRTRIYRDDRMPPQLRCAPSQVPERPERAA
jgi:hypothetical protein